MSELCNQCRHRRRADRAAIESLTGRGASMSGLTEINKQRDELIAHLHVEELVYERQTSAHLDRRPVKGDWCDHQSKASEGLYHFCDWLEELACPFFQCVEAVAGCARCETMDGPCAAGRLVDGAVVPSGDHPAAAQAADVAVPSASDWRLPLGPAYDLHAVSVIVGDSLGRGSFHVDYELADSDQRPAIRGKGLAQTYLIFGGPGAGKTYYFKYLLAKLLAHPSKPGCLLLDPKGVLTSWIGDELRKIDGRADDLMVLEAGAAQNAFNILGADLPPDELGRLLSEVVLAGAAGIDEGWAVLISDLLESAAVVLTAANGHLTARALLGEILYRKNYKGLTSGKFAMEYPIVHTARRMAAESRDVDVRIACDRIADYFTSTEDRQRRFVRQVIERSLGELMSPAWEYLSSGEAGNSVYSGIISGQRVVSVAVGQESPSFQRSMSTLVKALFQQAVLADLSARSTEPRGGDAPPPVTPFFILACDEYAQAITEGETGLVSDSRFFSLSREAGCMSLLALQSVATGRSRFPAAMRDRWDGVLGNVTVKLFMKLNDVETAEMGSALAGTRHSFVPVLSQQRSAEGMSATDAVTMLEHPLVPPWYLTNRMAQGEALVHGTLDGESVPTSVFVKAPSTW